MHQFMGVLATPHNVGSPTTTALTCMALQLWGDNPLVSVLISPATFFGLIGNISYYINNYASCASASPP